MTVRHSATLPSSDFRPWRIAFRSPRDAKAPGPKELFIIEDASHIELYDGEGAGKAMSKLSPFFARNL
jgi:hypothetical protein